MANSWMQYPVGMEFNPETMRNEMVDFMAVAFSPVAVVKFFPYCIKQLDARSRFRHRSQCLVSDS